MFGWESRDKAILARIREGDETALYALYRKNRRTIRHFVLKNSGSEDDAEDLLQDSLIVFWEKCQRPEFQLSSNISTYLMAVAKKLWLKKLRSKKREVRLEGITGEEVKIESTGPSLRPDMAQLLSFYLNQLTSACKEVLYLYYYDGLKMEAIAERLGYKDSDTVKAKKYRCKKRLEELVRSHFRMEDFIEEE
jgi:RNA polymerase sigma factor (sigma-70 family)